MERVKIEVERYKASDGNIYKTEEEANHHELILSGVRKVCPDCKGKKKYLDEEGRHFVDCPTCSHKGWVEKKITWR